MATLLYQPALLHEPLPDGREQNLFFLVARMVEHVRGHFRLQTEVHQQRGVTAVIQNHVRHAAIGPFKDTMSVFPVLLEGFALHREYRRAGGGNGGSGVILRRIDIAGRPAHVGAKRREGLDQHGGLDGHMQRAGDTGPAQRLLGPVFLAGGHQAGHFGFGNGDFLAAPIGEADVLDDIIGVRSFRLGRLAHGGPLALLCDPHVS